MPLSRKLNFEVGARTWRFYSDDDTKDGPPRRGGYFETTPRATLTKSKPSTTSTVSLSARSNPNSNPAKSLAPSIAPPEPKVIVADPSQDLKLAEQLEKIDLERQQIAREKQQIEEMSRQTQIALQHAEQIRQQVAEEGARAAEEEAYQRRLHQQELEQGKQNMLIEADLTIQKLREEYAVAQENYRIELALFQERQERALSLQSEAEARAKEREAAEAARAIQREQEIVQERTAEIARLKQEAIEEYKRTHDELRRHQEQQLRKELEEARQKIDEETAARKAAFEAEREASLLKLKEEARLEYQKQLDSHLQLAKGTTQALKDATTKAAEEFKAQSQQALKSLRSFTADSYQRSEVSISRSASDRKTPSIKPTTSVRSTPNEPKPQPPPSPKQPTPKSPPAKNSSGPSEDEIRQKREAMLQRLIMNVYTPNVHRLQEWGVRSAPPPFPPSGLSPSATWASPAHRARASSVGQDNLSTPFVAGSSMPGHLGSHQVYSMRNANMTQSNQDLYSRPGHPLNQSDFFQTHPVPRSSPIPPTGHINSPNHNTWSMTAIKNHDTYGQPNPSKPSAPAQHQHQHLVEKSKSSNTQQHQPPSGADPQPWKSFGMDMLPITTLQTIPGCHINAVFGIVYGVVLRDSTKEQTERSIALERKQAMTEMWKQAERLGANFVIGLKFQSTPVSIAVTEISGFGTAVTMAFSGDPNGTTSGYYDHNKHTAVENEGAGLKSLPPTKPNKAKKDAVTAPEGQTNKGKNKGKRGEQNSSQTAPHQDKNHDWNNPNTDSAWNAAETNNDGSDPMTSHLWDNSGTNDENNYPSADTMDHQQDDSWKDNFNGSSQELPAQSNTWEDNNSKSHKKKNKDKNTKKQAESTGNDDVNSGGFEYPWNEVDSAQHHEASGQNESKKAQKGKKGNNKGEGEANKDKGEAKNGPKVKQTQNQPPAPEPSSTSQTQAPSGDTMGYPPLKLIEYHQTPNLPLVASNRPWPPPGGFPGIEYDDPRYMYPYHNRGVYEHEYFSRRGIGYEYHPMSHRHPPMDMYGSLPPSQYMRMPRAPMPLPWHNDGNTSYAQSREPGQAQISDRAQWGSPTHFTPSNRSPNQLHSHPNAYPPSDDGPRNPCGGTESGPRDKDHSKNELGQGHPAPPVNNVSKKNPKGKPTHQAPKKAGPPPQPPSQDDYSWPTEFNNDSNSRDDSTAVNNNNPWNTNANEGGKPAGGKNAKKRNNAPEPQRRQNGPSHPPNGKSNVNRKRVPSPDPTASTSQDTDEEEEEDEGSEGDAGLGLLSIMSVIHLIAYSLHPKSFSLFALSYVLILPYG